jgi:peptide methionine sulfoxide reductase msrA/msrB
MSARGIETMSKKQRTTMMLSVPMLGILFILILLVHQPDSAEPVSSRELRGDEGAMLIDDFKTKTATGFPNNSWRFVPDSVMGGVSSGRMDIATSTAIPLLRMRGEVALKEGNGFILVALDLATNGTPFDASQYSGIRLAVKGNGEKYSVHLKTPECERPWQYYGADIETNNEWQVLNIPFKKFTPHKVENALDKNRLTRISLVGTNKSYKVDLQVARVSFYKGEPSTNKKLTAYEKAVILNRATERAFTGEYHAHKQKGVYTCKNCGTTLFPHTDKFESNCGWPSFDDALEGAVLRLPDADGQREEILCTACGGHLGHVFEGEKLTDKNTRYCVNSVSLEFVPAKAAQTATRETAIFASGCFWGTEYFLQKVPGVLETTVGYTGGNRKNPTYREICTGRTGHAEAVKVVFDPSKTSYEELTKIFFETHDFSQVDRQGPDIGTQYRSEIFYLTPEQKQVADKLAKFLKDKGNSVATNITQAKEFWPADSAHQDYYKNNGQSPYCHIYRKIF